MFGGNAALATSLFARINAMQQASVIKDIVMMPTFHFHKLSGNMDGFFAIDGDFYPLIRKAFEDAGVIFVILPNLPGSGINGATKKIGQNVMLMVNDRRFYSDTFWFTLFHEIGHIINGDYGITFENEHAGQEDAADKYAEDKLIPPGEYEAFVRMNEFSENAIRRFAERIDRDPGIVLGRLQNDQIVPFTNVALSKALKHKYKVITS